VKLKNKFLLASVFLLSELFSSAVHAQIRFDLNDVSYLLPLPQNLKSDQTLEITSYITTDFLKLFPRLHMRYPQADLFQTMKLVALRIDPVHRHIRAVWQPVIMGPGQQTTSLDVAVHSFYQLSDSNFLTFVSEIKKWKQTFEPSLQNPKALQIHPLIQYAFTPNHKLQSLQQSALTDLLKIFSKSMQKQTLFKVTAMALRSADDMWVFLGFEHNANGIPEPIQIARTKNQTVQTYVNTAVPFDHFEMAQITGMLENIEFKLGEFLYQVQNQSALSEDQIRSTLKTAHQLENPGLFKEDQMDCVHCHVAQSAREFLQTKYSNSNQTLFQNQYLNANYDLTNTTSDIFNTRQIRGFGYFDKGSAISQRVIHESAEAADVLNAIILKMALNTPHTQLKK
jgi:hypothetical protein